MVYSVKRRLPSEKTLLETTLTDIFQPQADLETFSIRVATKQEAET